MIFAVAVSRPVSALWFTQPDRFAAPVRRRLNRSYTVVSVSTPLRNQHNKIHHSVTLTEFLKPKLAVHFVRRQH